VAGPCRHRGATCPKSSASGTACRRWAKKGNRGFSFENLLADKGYDADRFRASTEDAGAQVVIPSNRSRSQAIPYDKDLYEERNLVERFINNITHYRRIATGYEKTVVRAIPRLDHDLAEVNVHIT
jgi:hypothetical protein